MGVPHLLLAAAASLVVKDLNVDDNSNMRKRSSHTLMAAIVARGGGASQNSLSSDMAGSVTSIKTARDIDDLGDEGGSMSLLGELRQIHFFTSLSSLVITSINVWNIRFKHYEIVMFCLLCGWTTFFMRYERPLPPWWCSLCVVGCSLCLFWSLAVCRSLLPPPPLPPPGTIFIPATYCVASTMLTAIGRSCFVSRLLLRLSGNW